MLLTSEIKFKLHLILTLSVELQTIMTFYEENYAALPWQKEPTDIFGEIELSLGNGQGWWYLPNKFTIIQLP